LNNHLKSVSMNVMCLFLNTKTRSDIEVKWENEWGSKVNGYLVMAIVNVPELVFLLKNRYDFKVNDSIFDQNGPYICVLLYWTTVQFKILNCRPFSGGFLVYFISVFFKLMHLHECVFEEEINKRKKSFCSFFFVWILTFVLYKRVIVSFQYIRHTINGKQWQCIFTLFVYCSHTKWWLILYTI
jgi:hypothetical protein